MPLTFFQIYTDTFNYFLFKMTHFLRMFLIYFRWKIETEMPGCQTQLRDHTCSPTPVQKGNHQDLFLPHQVPWVLLFGQFTS